LSLFIKPYHLLRDHLPANPSCLAHESLPEEIPALDAGIALSAAETIRRAHKVTPQIRAIELPYDLVTHFVCPACGANEAIMRPKGKVFQAEAVCPHCRALRLPQIIQNIDLASPLAGRTLAEFGLPEREIIAFSSESGKRAYLALSG
jgi:adenylyltransferase/sulfurtransferase